MTSSTQTSANAPTRPRACFHPQRMWVNQPSTLQPFHHRHGKKGLAAKTAKRDQAIVFIVHDDSSTSEPLAMPALCLSHGWPNGEPAVNYDPIAAANPRRAYRQPQRMILQSHSTATSAEPLIPSPPRASHPPFYPL